jgi:hypothetical protein
VGLRRRAVLLSPFVGPRDMTSVMGLQLSDASGDAC